MPVLYILIIIGVIALWFLLAGIYRPLGRLFTRIFKDSMKAMDINNNEKNKEDKNE